MSEAFSNHYMTIAETAEALGVSGPMVRKILKRGELRYLKVGAAYRIYAESVRHYITRNTHGGGANG